MAIKTFPFTEVEFYLNSYPYYKNLASNVGAVAEAVDPMKSNKGVLSKTTPTGKDPTVVFSNNKFSNIKVLDIYYKNFGTDWKVSLLTDDGTKIICYIKDHIIINFIKSGGSIINSTLSGDWRFINKIGAMLVPIGSDIEVKYTKDNLVSTITKVKAKDVKIGSVYKGLTDAKSGRGESIVYLGKLYRIELPDPSDITSIQVASKKIHVTARAFQLLHASGTITPQFHSSGAFPTLYTGYKSSKNSDLGATEYEDLISLKGQTTRGNTNLKLNTEFRIHSRKTRGVWLGYSNSEIESTRTLNITGGYSLDKDYLQSICDSIKKDYSNGAIPKANSSLWSDIIYTKTIPLDKVSSLWKGKSF